MKQIIQVMLILAFSLPNIIHYHQKFQVIVKWVYRHYKLYSAIFSWNKIIKQKSIITYYTPSYNDILS